MGIAVSPQIHPQVADFIEKPRKMLINGNWVSSISGKTFPTYNPATGEVLAQVAEGDREDIEQAVKAARKAFDQGPWRKLTASERGRLIWKLADLLESHTEEFAYLESLDNGKPLTIARAADVPLAVDLFRYMAGWTTKIEGNTIPISVPYTPGAKYLAYTLREPVGVAGQIIPWNFPLLMAAWKLGPALAAGCTVVLKPAEQTPLSALRLGELITKTDLPKGYAIHIRGEISEMQRAVQSLGGGFLLAAIMVYLILVVQFESFVLPLIMMMAVPLGIVGVILMLAATHTYFSIQAAIGAIFMIGIAVANGVLLIEFIQHHLGEHGVKEAILHGASARLRPILMTALASVLGLVPMAVGIGHGSEANIPLGRAVIGGQLLSTALTLFVVPVLFSLVKTRKGEKS